MHDDVVIKVEGVNKKFTRSIRRSMLYGSTDIFKSFLGINAKSSKLRRGEFWSLQDINLEIKKGETFGLIGANGSGKSTLLRLLNGIYPPDTGKIQVQGRIGALIAVGAGFHPHLSGRENIYLNGIILGMTRAEINRKLNSIIEFADIGNFLEAPVSTYSSGMNVRLGFSIAIHCDPDILLIDEILAVGDAFFQRKCLDKIRELRDRGTTIIIVSHNTQSMGALCNRALLLDHGEQIIVDKAEKVISAYELLESNKDSEVIEHQIKTYIVSPDEVKDDDELKFIEKFQGYGTDEIDVKHIRLVDKDGKNNLYLRNFEPVTLEVVVDSPKDVTKAYIWASFRYVNDYSIDDKNFDVVGFKKEISLPKGETTMRIPINEIALSTGIYKLKFNIMDEFFQTPYSQGKYGYIKVQTDIPTMLRVNQGTSGCFIDPEIEFIHY